MRPVLLEMAGFASFREHAVVDFRDAEYFALVGPTGSGKSTVVDALTFALYGSVPRWDDRRTVAHALAPTAVRGVVRLVFDACGARYVVARELRRAASGGVTVRNARLERLVDPSGTGGDDEETEPLADGGPAVSRAVEELLGLPFGDFITCVVLPQGDFAEFLHAEPRKRQEKLVRILGLGVYDAIAREANAEAAAHRQRADLLADQLGAYADATADAERAATDAVGALTALGERVAAAVPELTAATATAEAARAEVDRLDAERALLAAVAVPAGSAELDARQRAHAASVATAEERAGAAEAADSVARERLDAAPARGPLEQARRDHAERADLAARLPELRQRHDEAAAAYAAAARDAADATLAVDAARADREAAAAAVAAAEEAVRRLTDEHTRFLAVRPPAGLDALDARRRAAADGLAAARSGLGVAEEAEAKARARLAAAPVRGPLEQALRDHRALAAQLAAHAAATRSRAAAERAAAAAEDAVRRARAHVENVRAEHAERARRDLAAHLRPALVAGQECPVCAQEVAVVPAPLPAADLEAAQRAVDEAERAHDAARERAVAAAGVVAAAGAEVDRSAAEIERLRVELAGAPGSAEAVEAELAALDALAGAVEDAAAAVREARRAQESAARESDEVRADAERAAGALRAARDPLVALGAPAPDEVTAGWADLVAWAAGEAAAREAELPGRRESVAAAQATLVGAERTLAAAQRAAAQLRAAETAAARTETETRTALDAVERRAAELVAALDGAPAETDAAEGLRRLDALEAAVREADAQVRQARAAVRAARTAAADVDREVAAAWQELRSARDPLVPLGAPAVVGEELLAAWTALAGWAGSEAAARADRLAAAESAAAVAAERRDAVARGLADALAAHGVDVPAGRPLPETAPAAAAGALERARAARERIVERRATARRLAAERAEAESGRQVARMLGGLLRSDGFPRWLVASALDTLVADASRSLAELSGGQFELTHDHGEFLVVDHADADARRPVKTLSGGETFQASLALALALSAQMSGLAARGAARLESIFLDEGFGTLDEANLEVVAGTLENLAVHGDRTVGVITHVAALAERVPVRFAVRRDQRTSSIVREPT